MKGLVQEALELDQCRYEESGPSKWWGQIDQSGLIRWAMGLKDDDRTMFYEVVDDSGFAAANN